jgi:hypothetical protein
MVGRSINLELMDEPEFRAFCAEMFNALDYGTVERRDAKKGSDFVIHSAEGKILVECKFKPRSSIGKAVVQSLHSEMSAIGAAKGIVVTTGGFTKDVIQYVGDHQLPIELIDANRLTDLMAKAGYGSEDGRPGPRISVLSLPEKKEMDAKLAAYLDNKLYSSPKGFGELIDVRNVNASLIPTYLASYTVNAVFSTSAGRIHEERATGRLLINGNSGEYLGEGISNYISRSSSDALIPFDGVAEKIQNKEYPCFTLPMNRVNDALTRTVMERHTRNVVYYGRNNQRYTKTCTPNRNQIEIHDITQLYLPQMKVSMNLFGREHEATFIDAGNPDILVLGSTVSQCATCGKDLSAKGILCNECGGSVCLTCGTVKKRMFLFRTVLCPRCAEQSKRR